MKCSVFIATSADGYIATKNGDVDWLEHAGKESVEAAQLTAKVFSEYLSTIDCIIMGRNTMEKIASFNLSAEMWPYGDIPIYVLSKSLKKAPDNVKGKVKICSREILDLVSELENEGYQSAYIDGGATITSFLNQKLISEMTITRAPILLGEGIPLFGKLDSKIDLLDAEVEVYPNDFIQLKYKIAYRS